jgi:hypothetical protein
VRFAWLTASSRSCAQASAFAVLTPTSRAPASPGPAVTATAARSRHGAGLDERGVDHLQDHLEVVARRDLGHDAAVLRVQV